MPLEPSAVWRSPGGLKQTTKTIISRVQAGLTRTYPPLRDLSGIGADPSQLIHRELPQSVSGPRVYRKAQ
jgi:hypothetical protein